MASRQARASLRVGLQISRGKMMILPLRPFFDYEQEASDLGYPNLG
jgi:hypothetical protein